MDTYAPSAFGPKRHADFYRRPPRPLGNNYTMPTVRRTTHNLWQERLTSNYVEKKTSRGKFCSILLAVASFLVLVAVLSIAGMALYMGALHTDPGVLTFGCSARILRGDRFVGVVQEKARRYRMQLEALYQKSVLGSALISCTVERLGNDTVYFTLGLNRKKVNRNVPALEKLIRDILLTDALTRKPVFRNVRFDPKNVVVHFNDENQRNAVTKPKPSGVVLKASRNNTTTLHTNLPVRKKIVEEIDVKEEDLPVIQGSFKITKTEADLTEKKTETTTIRLRTTSRKTMLSTVTSALHKIATGTTEKTMKPPEITTSPKPNFTFTPNIFDEEPWIPILPNTKFSTPSPPVTFSERQPIYTSFTNPGLSYHSFDGEPLGSTSLVGHPIPVNKIPAGTTEISLKKNESDDFVEIETVKYTPGTNKEHLLKNISSIFHSLVSTLDAPQTKEDDDVSLGQGQVEVVDGDEATLIMQTTKVPLVTLIPVKSNSGIRAPLRRRPNEDNSTNLSVENRSFPGSTRLNDFNNYKEKFVETEVVTSVSSEVNKPIRNKPEDIKIVGMLNFATESTLEDRDSSELIRNPKMDGNTTDDSEIIVFVTNSTVSASNQDKKQFNVLTPEKLKQLSEISKLNDNFTTPDKEALISTKAVSSSYTINHSGFKVLTKTLNKINELNDNDKSTTVFNSVPLTTHSNSSDCGNYTIRCGDGQCLPETTKCNQLIDCNDGKDEQDCNCADYLRSQYLLRKICDGVVDCWDYSDENQCEWCRPDQYVCGNSKVCINKTKICDGVRDCPQGDDERQCVTIATNLKTADEFPYFSEGNLMVRKFGEWGKLCVENFQNVVLNSQVSWEISDLGKAVCKSMTYKNLDRIESLVEIDQNETSKYFELSYSFQNKTRSSLSFKETDCDSKKIVKVKCESLECGARPQAVKHIARIVGGGNAGLGSWPWQAALYKEGEFQCGATLLSDKWLVSAGHCFYHSLDEYWVARLGALRRGTTLPSPYEQLRKIIKISIHPGYVDSGFINDISLLQMETPVIFSDYVRPICLPTAGQPATDGTLCTVIGWGQLFEVGRIFPDTLQEVQVPVISTLECRKRTVFLPLYKITDDMFCAGYERGGRDACLGDSGGPLMCPETNGRWVLQGITSNGYGCARANRPGVYTKVANYVNWMRLQMSNDGSASNSSTKSVCLGHRCPLGECLPKSRLCNGYIECSDGSDEKNC